MVDEHELLVHISTPATRQNDRLFRSLADAYLNFEPHQENTEVSQRDHISSQSTDTSQVSDPAEPNQGSSFRGNLDTSILSTGKDSYGSFPSHLSSDERDEFEPSSSRLARLECIHRNWKAQTTSTLSAVRKQGVTNDAPSSPEDEDVDTAFIEDTQVDAMDLQSQMSDSFETGFEDSDGFDVECGDGEGTREPTGVNERTTTATADTFQSQSQDSSLMLYKGFEDDEDAANAAHEVPPSSDQSVEHTTAATVEELVPLRAAPSHPVPAAVGSRRKSTRLEEARGTTSTKTPDFSKQHPECCSLVQEYQERARSKHTSKPATSFKVPTVVANHRKSTRLEEARATGSKAPAPSKPRLEFSSAIPGQQESLRSNDASKHTASPLQHKASEVENVHETKKLDQPVDFTQLPFSVLAPEPKIGITSPVTLPSQITPYLATIKTQNPTRFRPVKKLHSPAADTRGWWSIQCSQWPAHIQKDFWDAVCERLEDGRLGWATSLHREVGVQALGEVRLYCWGELVEHMWLVLWVCSNGRVEGAGLKWFDAWKTAVFEME